MALTTPLIILIRLYQVIVSPLIRSMLGISAGCRYTETCSSYAIRVFREDGLLQGGKKAIIRLLGCHPFKKSYANL